MAIKLAPKPPPPDLLFEPPLPPPNILLLYLEVVSLTTPQFSVTHPPPLITPAFDPYTHYFS